jgi:hypothetical protein
VYLLKEQQEVSQARHTARGPRVSGCALAAARLTMRWGPGGLLTSAVSAVLADSKMLSYLEPSLEDRVRRLWCGTVGMQAKSGVRRGLSIEPATDERGTCLLWLSPQLSFHISDDSISQVAPCWCTSVSNQCLLQLGDQGIYVRHRHYLLNYHAACALWVMPAC